MEDNKEEVIIFLRRGVLWGVVSVAALLPLFFLPQTTEFFEFNKQMLLATATLILLLAWTVRMVLLRKLSFVRSSFDVFLIFFFLSYLAATVFAENRTTALFGPLGRLSESVVILFVLLIFFYLAAAHVKTFLEAKVVLLALGLSAALASALGLSHYFGHYLPFDFANRQTFTPLGTSTALAVLAAAVGPVLTALFLYEKRVAWQLVEGVALFLCLLLLVFFNITAAWVVLAAGLPLPLFLERKTLFGESGNRFLLGIVVPVAVLAVLNLCPPVRQTLPFLETGFPRPRSLGLSGSWQVTVSVIKNRPLFGSGPGSFMTDYTRFRPLSLNGTDFWNTRFLRAGNYYFELLATTGILGFLAFFFLAVAVVGALFREAGEGSRPRGPRNERRALRAAVLSGAGGLLAALALTGATITLLFSLFLFLAVAAALRAKKEGVGETVVSLSLITDSIKGRALRRSNLRGDELLPWAALGLAVGLSLLALWQGSKVYAGEVSYKKALVALSQNRNIDAYNRLIAAVSRHPRSDLFHRNYSQLNLALANAFAKNTDDPTARQTALQLVSQAVREANLATQVNPFNVFNWENRAGIYRALMGAAQNAEQFALDSYNRAIQLDPTNPDLRINLGGLYYSRKDWEAATAAFSAAVRLKPDYANAHYNLALALKGAGDAAGAKTQLELTLRLVPQKEDNPDYQTVKKQLAELEETPQQAEISSPGRPRPGAASELKSASPSATAREMIESSLERVEESTTTALPR